MCNRLANPRWQTGREFHKTNPTREGREEHLPYEEALGMNHSDTCMLAASIPRLHQKATRQSKEIVRYPAASPNTNKCKLMDHKLEGHGHQNNPCLLSPSPRRAPKTCVYVFVCVKCHITHTHTNTHNGFVHKYTSILTHTMHMLNC